MARDRQKVVQAAEKLAARGRIQAAIDEYRKVLDRHPNDTTTLNRVGDLYVRLNRLPKAIDLFQKTAESFGRQGFFVKAIAIYKKMIRLDPGQIRAYEALADLYNRQGLTGDSLAQYQVVADYYMKHNDAEAALNIHYSMVEIEPTNPTRRLQLADVLQKEGKKAQAQEQYFEIASLMLTHSRGDDAVKVLTGALDIDAANLDFVRKAMHALQNAGFDRLGESLLDEAIKRNPQANALRLDSLETSPAQEPKPASKAPKPAAKKPAATKDEPAADKAAVADAEVEVELTDLEELPAEDLDRPVEVDPVAEAEAEGSDAELEAPDRESTFELDDVEPVEEEAAAAEEPGSAEPEAGDDFTFELDIDEVSAQLAEVDEESAEVIPRVEELDETPGEEPGPEAQVEPATSKGEWTKLLIEADVLGRYGMNEMALAVLERVLQAEPEQTEALTRRVLLLLGAERDDEALVSANGLANLVTEAGEPQRWGELLDAMAERGFQFGDGRFSAAGDEAPVDEVPAEPEDASSLAEIVAETAALARPKPPVVADSADGVLAEVIEEIERADGTRTEDDEEPAEATEAAEAAEPSEEAESPTAPLEPGTGDFIDLATELEAELSEDGDFEDELLPSMGEQSLEDIVEGFRQGMAETLSDEDYDTHYNLGIAYREMELLDEAIGEFQLAAKDPRYLVECCSLLASCFVDKGFDDLAIQWYARGIESSAIDEESKCGLLYELASLLAASGEPEAARERFLELYGMNSSYRDVGARLEELAS